MSAEGMLRCCSFSSRRNPSEAFNVVSRARGTDPCLSPMPDACDTEKRNLRFLQELHFRAQVHAVPLPDTAGLLFGVFLQVRFFLLEGGNVVTDCQRWDKRRSSLAFCMPVTPCLARGSRRWLRSTHSASQWSGSRGHTAPLLSTYTALWGCSASVLPPSIAFFGHGPDYTHLTYTSWVPWEKRRTQAGSHRFCGAVRCCVAASSASVRCSKEA